MKAIRRFMQTEVWGIPTSTGTTFILLLLCMVLTGIHFGWLWGLGLFLASIAQFVIRDKAPKSNPAAVLGVLVFCVIVTAGSLAASRLFGLPWGIALASVTCLVAFLF